MSFFNKLVAGMNLINEYNNMGPSEAAFGQSTFTLPYNAEDKRRNEAALNAIPQRQKELEDLYKKK
jgi:hypothetical protein